MERDNIHSSGQIEWFKNSVDDRSVQVGGKKRICTTDGYAMPLTCRGGLMYFSILGKPTDKDLERYPAVHLTGPHEWDSSVLDYTHPSGDAEPPWSNDHDERYAFDANFDEFGDYIPKGLFKLSASLTEFRQPLQVQSHLELPRILVQLGHIQRT